MKKIDWYISDDGKFKGTEQEVREYEEKQKNPLNGMHFPYARQGASIYRANEGPWAGNSELDALIAFANLAPLIAEFEFWDRPVMRAKGTTLGRLMLAFDEACKLIPRD